MAIDNMILELIDEDNKPEELYLDDIVEEAAEQELDTVSGYAEKDDDLIDFIDHGGRMGYKDPVNFIDADVDYVLNNLDD